VHRVDRVLSFFSSRWIRTPPPLHPQASVPPPPPFGSGGEGTLAYGSGVGRDSNSNDPVVLKVYIRGLQRDVVYLC
jgi:hypothetical protein